MELSFSSDSEEARSVYWVFLGFAIFLVISILVAILGLNGVIHLGKESADLQGFIAFAFILMAGSGIIAFLARRVVKRNS